MRIGIMAAVVAALVVSGCGGGTGSQGSELEIVATTSVIGDLVRHSAAPNVDVEVLIPPGADPHDYEPSARTRQRIASADLVVTAGLGLEETLGDTLASAPERTVFEMAPASGVDDPHFWLDVRATAEAVRALGVRLDEIVSGAGGPAAEYAERLDRLDEEIATIVDGIPADRRLLVTGHDELGAFAERHGFEVVGTITGTANTQADTSARRLADLATAIRERAIPAIFVAHGEETRVARALAAEAGGVTVVALPIEALGAHDDHAEEADHGVEEDHGESEADHGLAPADTYEEMMRTIATEIRAALA